MGLLSHEAKGEYLLNRITEDHNDNVKLHSHYINMPLCLAADY